MKKHLRILIAIAATLVTCSASAQYYQIANQVANTIFPALSGNVNYKGYVEATGLAGFGTNKANSISVSTSQGFKYSSWFFWGVGFGVDVLKAYQPDKDYPWDDYYVPSDYAKTKVMIPVFTDMRFDIGNQSRCGMYVDVKVGASWLIGNSYLGLENGYLTNGTQFFLRPSIGLRIPVSSDNSNRAFNIGVTYQLLTANYNYYWQRTGSATLNNVGVSLGFEW